MTSKIKIRMGAIEVEYEGSEEFLRKELPDLLAAVSKLYRESGGISEAAAAHPNASVASSKDGSTPTKDTTSVLAQKLGVKSGAELIIAGAAKLTRAGQQSFSRQTLTDEIKSASAYFKKNYVNNLSKYLVGLVRAGRLSETATDTYALSQNERQAVDAKLAAK